MRCSFVFLIATIFDVRVYPLTARVMRKEEAAQEENYIEKELSQGQWVTINRIRRAIPLSWTSTETLRHAIHVRPRPHPVETRLLSELRNSHQQRMRRTAAAIRW